jgi:hypothetical protein
MWAAAWGVSLHIALHRIARTQQVGLLLVVHNDDAPCGTGQPWRQLLGAALLPLPLQLPHLPSGVAATDMRVTQRCSSVTVAHSLTDEDALKTQGVGDSRLQNLLAAWRKAHPKGGGAMCIWRRCEQVLHSNLGPLQSLFKMSPAVQLKLFAASCKIYHAPTPYFLEINGDYAPLAQFAPMSQCPMYSVGKHGTWRVQRASGPAFVINGHHTA